MTPLVRLLVVVGMLAWVGGAVPASAEDRGLYIGAKRGSTNIDASLGDTFRQSLRGDEDTSAILVGYRFGRFWAIEAARHDLGKVRGEFSQCSEIDLCVDPILPEVTEAETEAYSVALIPQLPLGLRFTVYGKAGLASWDSSVRVVEQGPPRRLADRTEQDFLYGFGARMKLIAGLRLFGEWETIGGNFETTSFGLLFQF